MILDITIPTAGIALAELAGPGVGADLAAGQYGNAGFTGAELGQLLLGSPARTIAALQQSATPIPVTEALEWRGALVVTPTGRAGVTLGAGLVLEPAGRRWALITDQPGRYTWAGLLPTVTYTIRKPIFEFNAWEYDMVYRATVTQTSPLQANIDGLDVPGAVNVSTVLPPGVVNVGDLVLVARVAGGPGTPEWVLVTGPPGPSGSAASFKPDPANPGLYLLGP